MPGVQRGQRRLFYPTRQPHADNFVEIDRYTLYMMSMSRTRKYIAMRPTGGEYVGDVSSTSALVCIQSYVCVEIRSIVVHNFAQIFNIFSFVWSPFSCRFLNRGPVFEPTSLFFQRKHVANMINLAPAVILWSIRPGHAELYSCFG